MILKPPSLKQGDTIGIVSPSGSLKTRESLENGIRYLEGLGYRVKMGAHVYDTRQYLAGLDRDRANDLNAMLADPDVRAIFCARGGYGSGRILDLVDYDLIIGNPKIFVGLSDTTALQLAIYSRTGLVTFSGVTVSWDMKDGRMEPLTERSLWDALTSDRPLRVFGNAGSELKVLKEGKARGRLIGGCLSIICSILGTPYQPDFKGAILFLEDVGEYPYRVDRMINQLRLAGILREIVAMVLGQFKDCFTPEEMEQSLSLEEIVSDLTSNLDIPVLSGLPYGHFDQKLVLPIGVMAEVDSDKGELRVVEGALSEKL